MKPSSKVLALAAFSAAIASASLPTMAADQDMEKCYGVVKAGHNDCATANSSCAGTSKSDSQSDAFVMVPEGLCDRLAGGSKTSS
ncbi:MAG: DUF2282 domain-containing protein [Gammaproteobacteria bacterium]|nr:DUF2282 domain-containing protein [Gammaproteobacteria bacterium]